MQLVRLLLSKALLKSAPQSNIRATNDDKYPVHIYITFNHESNNDNDDNNDIDNDDDDDDDDDNDDNDDDDDDDNDDDNDDCNDNDNNNDGNDKDTCTIPCELQWLHL